MKIQNQLIIFVILIAACLTTSEDFRFTRSLECVDKNLSHKYCQNWNQTTTLYRYSLYTFYCFPAQTYVLTSEGPKQMKDLKLTDSILGLDPQTQKTDFFPIQAWLHYDANSLFKYNEITVQNSEESFYISGYHNVGYISDNQNYGFKFAKDVQIGDQLISLTKNQQSLIVKNNSLGEEKVGLFSPMTSKGTFYVYSNYNGKDQQNENDLQQRSMILVHCLSQINNPIKNFNKASYFMSVHSLFGNEYEPSQQDEYVNPLLSHFSFIFNQDWQKAQGVKILHRYTSSSSSYSDQQRREREQRKRKTMAVLSLNSILKDTMI